MVNQVNNSQNFEIEKLINKNNNNIHNNNANNANGIHRPSNSSVSP